ncbi:hypothetical protein C1645_812866 [Glomus cerebriforme]|uniref:RNase H type-1 domain-containing protein n=1 Tax=Glomus cerebriforme TaxID=658196 RepID=A0A397TJB1_9GLOM|nr:hypothetical protein C1645_812866 [Glomus cerebriforme]
MFIDQLTSLNGEFLLPWSSITSRIFTQHNVTSITPIWFKTLQNIVLFNPSSGSLQLKSQFIFRSNNFKGMLLQLPPMNTRSKSFVVTWNYNSNTLMIGRIIDRNNNNLHIEHWVPNQTLSLIHQPVIQRCSGCLCNTESLSCSTWSPLNDTIFIVTSKKNQKVSEGLYRLPSPLFEYQQQIIHHMNFSRQIMPYYFKQQKFWHFEDNLIKRYIEKGSLQNQLLHYQNIFESSTNLEFYTDGSLIDPAMNTMSMGFALIQSSSAAPYIEFAARIERWPSSYRAELAAILVALIISPMNSTITIFTDSKSSIDHFFYLQQQQLPLSPRNLFKEDSNNYLWTIIMDIIEINSIIVKFFKIQSHSGNHYNDLIRS